MVCKDLAMRNYESLETFLEVICASLTLKITEHKRLESGVKRLLGSNDGNVTLEDKDSTGIRKSICNLSFYLKCISLRCYSLF